jgi:hypothetical protein
LTIKIVQSNERVAEVQFVCDCCGKLIRTCLITREEAEAQKNTKQFAFNANMPKTKRISPDFH